MTRSDKCKIIMFSLARCSLVLQESNVLKVDLRSPVRERQGLILPKQQVIATKHETSMTSLTNIA